METSLSKESDLNLPNKILENYQLLITFLIFGYITILISINHVSHVTLILNTVKKY